MNNPLFVKPATIWFELPYRVFLDLQERKIYRAFNGERIRVTLRIRNDIVKYYSADFHDSRTSWDVYASELRKRKKSSQKLLFDSPSFIPLEKFNNLKKKKNGPRLHGVFNKTYIEVKMRLPRDQLLPRDLLFPFLFDWINEIITTYRISILPWARYTIDTISEANLNRCVIQSGRKTILYGFSVRDHGDLTKSHFFSDYAVEERFSQLRDKLSESEITFSLAFPLFHQHRHKESLLVAYSSCETLLKELVFVLVKNKKLASILWKTHRNRSDDIFKVLLPMLGADDISKTRKPLWDEFKKARDARHLSAHDSDPKNLEEKDVRKHLQTFYEVCCWLVSQSKSKIKPWNLGLTHKVSGKHVNEQFPL